MLISKLRECAYIIAILTLIVSNDVFSQTSLETNHLSAIEIETVNKRFLPKVEFDNDSKFDVENQHIPIDWAIEQQSKEPERTTSLTVGYIANQFDIATDNGNYKYRYYGELAGLMLSSNASSFTLSYGITNAENEGDIRSIASDLNFGGNANIFSKFLGLPIKAYIPIRINLGYRNLQLIANKDGYTNSSGNSNNSLNLGKAGLGAGLGAKIRIPTGLPVFEDNLSSFISIVRSVGGMGDLSGFGDNNDFGQEEEAPIKGIRLTRNTDLNMEGKFENLLGDTGVTVGFTLRLKSWTDDEGENIGELMDVAFGEHEGLELRGTQSFFRVGINW